MLYQLMTNFEFLSPFKWGEFQGKLDQKIESFLPQNWIFLLGPSKFVISRESSLTRWYHISSWEATFSGQDPKIKANFLPNRTSPRPLLRFLIFQLPLVDDLALHWALNNTHNHQGDDKRKKFVIYFLFLSYYYTRSWVFLGQQRTFAHKSD